MRREIASDWSARSVNADGAWYQMTNEPDNQRRAFTPIQALMEAAPGDAIDPSQMEMLALRDVLSDAIERLDPRHRWVLEQNLIHRIPVRTLGNWMNLGKSYVWMLKQEALVMLREDLQDHPTIQAYLNRHNETEDE